MAFSRDLLIRLIAKDEASRALGGVEKSLSTLKTAAASFGIALSAGALAKGAYDLLALGAQAQQVEQSFLSLSRATGQSSTELLDALKSASRGAVNETDLMQQANFAMLAGGREMANALPQLMEIARAASIGLGQDMNFMFESIVKGIARGSPLILDNLGLIVSEEEANRKWADAMGTTVEAMTAQEKQQALLNDILAQAPAYIASVGAAGTTAAEELAIMRATWEDLRKSVAEEFIVAGTTGLGADIVDTLQKALLLNNAIDTVQEGIEEIRAQGRTGLADQLDKDAKGAVQLSASVASNIKRLQDLNQTIISLIDGPAGYLPTFFAEADGSVRRFDEAALKAALSVDILNTKMANGLSPTQYQTRSKKNAETFVEDYRRSGQEAQRALELAADQSTRAWEQSFRNMRSMAEQVLGGGLNVTQADFLATAAGTYQDAPLEAARRLADVANLGLESPWASFFQIPPEVLAQGTEAIKAWSAATRDDVVNLTRPDLIDWDAFTRDYQQLLNDNAARELTLDIAVGKLSEAGLLQGNEDQRKAQVARLLGIETPEIAVASMVSGFDAALSSNNPADKVLTNVRSGVDADLAGYATIGQQMGNTIGKAAQTAIVDGVGNVRTIIAQTVAPEVARILQSQEAQP